MYTVKTEKSKKVLEFDSFADACKRAREIGNTSKRCFVEKDGKELYRTR